jgi:hypothetical protein
VAQVNNNKPIYQYTPITLEVVKGKGIKRESTSLKVDKDLYKEFKMEALRRDMEISDLLDHAMRITILEGKKK